jgi:hypothetical protein
MLTIFLLCLTVASAEVRIKVSTDRITYAPGARGTVTVSIENLEGTPAVGTLQVRLLEGIDKATVLLDGPYTAPAAQRSVKTVPMEVGTALWGRAVEARYTVNGETTAGTHAFSVVTNPFMCAIWGRGLPQFGSETWDAATQREQTEAIAAGNIENYCNAYEAFAWAPCDYSVMHMDTDDPFPSGQTQYMKKASSLRALHDTFHRYGIFCISYGKACAAGVPGLDYAFKHPEQMHVFAPAGFAHEDISVDVLDRMAEKRFRRHGFDEDFWQRWISCWTQIGNKEAMDFGTDEIARSAKQFAWDGVRYDGHFSYWQNPEMAARVVKYAADRLQKQVPDFGIGYNYFGPDHDTPEGASTDPELAAAATGGGLMMSEVFRNYRLEVTHNILHLQSVGDAVRRHGGYFLAINDMQNKWNSALVLAGGARPMGGSNRAYNKFATRFSAFTFDPGLRRLQAPERILAPVGDPGFLWGSFIYERKVSETKSQLVLHLVNVSKALNFQGGEKLPITGENDPLENVAFTLKLPAGYKAERVFACDDYENFTPQAATLAGATITIPSLKVWTLAVIDLATPAGKSLAELCAVPLKDGKQIVTPEALKAIWAKGAPDNAAPKMENLVKPLDFADHKDSLDRKLSAAADTPLTLWRNGRPDIHYVCGINYTWNRPWEALMRVKGARVSTSSLDAGRTACASALSEKNTACVSAFPSRGELSTLDVLVIDNTPAAGFTLQQRRDILAFVKGGGNLLVLGDWHGLSKGSWEGSFLEEALPVKTKQATYLLRLQGADEKLAATPLYATKFKRAAPDFGAGPSIAWTSQIQPKDGAEVLVKAGARPFLVAGACGAGRVIVCAGSHSGTPASPYWQSAAWPVMLGDALNWLAEPAAQTTKPGAQLTAIHETLDTAKRYPSQEEVAQQLRILLTSRSEAEALYVAKFLLEHPEAVANDDIRLLTLQIVPYIKASEAWEALGRRYLYDPESEDKDNPETTSDLLLGKEGVRGETLLAAIITAKAVPDVNAQTFQNWEGLDTQTRFWCIGLCGDKSALPYLMKENVAILKQEQQWEGAPPHIRRGMYSTRLVRPFLTYALLRCGKRDEATRADFCRGALELPFYAWREHWILEGADDKSTSPNTPGIVRRVIWQLEYAVQLLPQIFLPEVVGMDDVGKRAAARALRDFDCGKSVPVALDFLDKVSDADLAAFGELSNAKLEPVRGYVKMRLGK